MQRIGRGQVDATRRKRPRQCIGRDQGDATNRPHRSNSNGPISQQWAHLTACPLYTFASIVESSLKLHVLLGTEIDIMTKYRSTPPQRENRQSIGTNKNESRKSELLFPTNRYSIATHQSMASPHRDLPGTGVSFWSKHILTSVQRSFIRKLD